MDNADKIKLTHKEVALFLGDDLKVQNEETLSKYNLEEEYAKTASHKSRFVWLLLAVCVALVAIGTTASIAAVSSSNQKIKVKIDTFNDLNLRSLLNMVSRSQSSYEDAVRQKESLQNDLQDDLDLAEHKRANDLFTLKSVEKVSSRASIEARQKKIQDEYEAAVKAAHANYDSQIEEADELIRTCKNQISAYDAGMLEKARKAESSIDSQKQLYDMEMKKQTEKYDKKLKALRLEMISQQIKATEEQKKAVEEVRQIYQAKIDQFDPKAREQSSDQDKIILDAGIQKSTSVSNLWNSIETLDFDDKSYVSGTDSPSENFVAALSKSRKNLSDLKTIALRFKPIPMENSIKDYVPAIVRQSYQIAEDFASGQKKMQSEIDVLKNQVSAQEQLMEQFAYQNGCDGFIINSADSEKMMIFLAKSKRTIVETQDNFTAQIPGAKTSLKITKEGNAYYASVLPPDPETQKKNPVPYVPKNGDRIQIVINQH